MGGLSMQVCATSPTNQFFFTNVFTQGVGWNVLSPENLQIQSPPTGENYCIGCIGTPIDKPDSPSNGTFIALNEVVSPSSLFAAQLAARGTQQGYTC